MRVVDLFCGCGGLSLGLERANFEVIWACDNWEKAVNVYRENFDHAVTQMDVGDVTKTVGEISKLGSIDGIVGGPPCQDFSSAGNRSEGGRADLTKSFAQIVDRVRPSFFIMENVARAKQSDAYRNAKLIFETAGYGITDVVLDASKCGVPQKRKRLFCIGILGGYDGAISPIFEQEMADEEMTVRHYMGGELDIDHYYRHPRNYNRRAVYSIDEPAATVRGVNRPVPAGYPGHRNDAASISGAIRPFTTRERARLQTFPNEFVWDEAKTHLELMIGNAVPVELARFVGRCLRRALDQIEIEAGDKESAVLVPM